MNKSLSIIIPTFKACDLLELTLASIASQDFKDLEVVVMDGYSEDGTKDVVEEYRKKNIEIVFVSEPDQGVYDAMNKGIKVAKGKWLYFLGAGDMIYKSDTLNTLAEYFDSDYQIIQGDIIIKSYKNTVYRDRLSGMGLLIRNFCHQGLFYRKSVFGLLGVYSLDYPIIADWEFNLRWFFNRKISRVYVPLIICDYLGGGLSSSIHDLKFHNDKNMIVNKLLKENPNVKNHLLVHFFNMYDSLSTKNRKRINRYFKLE
ncbi:glycosyltransferase family 2 protein [Peijinzhouia sedimentorum]